MRSPRVPDEEVTRIPAVIEASEAEDGAVLAELDGEFVERFWAKVRKSPEPNGCWEWIGARMGGTHHYGQLRRRGTTLYAHRVGYAMQIGEIPEGQRVLHKCDNPPCVRPDHLFAGTAEDNTQDMVAKGRARAEAHPGSTNGFAKLTEEKVIAIRERHAAGEAPRRLADEYGVSQANISLIVRGEAWKHILPGNAEAPLAAALADQGEAETL